MLSTYRFDEISAFKANRYAEAHKHWSQAALFGDVASHERLGSLLFGPHAKSIKPAVRDSTTGIGHIYLAAMAGLPNAMRTLSVALRQGTSGAQKLPAAARYWGQAPIDKAEINKCVAMTDFRSKRSRPSCRELHQIRSGSAADLALLCVANRTPALQVFTPPPGERDMMRAREYLKHGIELMFVGDVISEEALARTSEFNRHTADAIDARHGAGYAKRVREKVERDVEARFR